MSRRKFIEKIKHNEKFRKYYNKIKDDLKYREKERIRASIYYYLNRDKILAKMARQKPCKQCGYRLYYGKCPNQQCLFFNQDAKKIKIIESNDRNTYKQTKFNQVK